MLFNRKPTLSLLPVIALLCISSISCGIKTINEVEEEKYPIILGLKLGDNYHSIKIRIDSLKATGKIISTSDHNFNFKLPLITDSINCRTGIDRNDFYKGKLYQLYVYTDIEGSWKDVIKRYAELKELFSHKYTHTTTDSSRTYIGYGDNEEVSRIYNKWKNEDIEIRMEHYVIDVSKVPLNKDWNYSSNTKQLTNFDIFNKTNDTPGRYVIVLNFTYKLCSLEDAYYSEDSFRKDSLNNLEIQKREQKKDSLMQNL